MYTIARLDRKIYSCVTEDITTDEVILTAERIDHIRKRHPKDYEQYFGYMADMIEKPHYIIEDDTPDTAFVLKSFGDNEGQFRLILRLHTSRDPKGRKNSVITFQYVRKREYDRLIRNKKHLYKAAEI